jgi:hypothetical protein
VLLWLRIRDPRWKFRIQINNADPHQRFLASNFTICTILSAAAGLLYLKQLALRSMSVEVLNGCETNKGKKARDFFIVLLDNSFLMLTKLFFAYFLMTSHDIHQWP